MKNVYKILEPSFLVIQDEAIAAIQHDDLPKLQSLFDEYKALNSYAFFLFGWIVSKKPSVRIAEIFLERRVDMEIGEGYPLNASISHENFELAEFLIASGADWRKSRHLKFCETREEALAYLRLMQI